MATAHAAGAAALTFRLLHMMVMGLILVLEVSHRVLLRCPCHLTYSKSLNGGLLTTPLLLASLEYTDVELDRMAAAEQTSLAKTVEQATKAERLAHQEVQWRLDSGGAEAQPMQEPQPMEEDDAGVPWLRGHVVDYMYVEANLHTFSDDDLEKLVAHSAIGLEQWQQYRLHLQRMRGVDEDNLSDLGSEVADNDMEPQDRDKYRDLKRRAVEQGLDVQSAQEYTDLLSKRIMAKAGKRARVVSSVTADMYRSFCVATAKQMGAMAPNRGRSLALLALAAAVLPVTSTLIGAEALRELEADFGKAELQLWAQGSSTQSTTAPVGTSTQTTTASGSRGGRAKVMDFRNDSSSGQQENLTLADRVRPTLRPAAGDGPRGVAKTGPPSSQATWTTTPPAAEAAANAGRQNSSAPQAAAHAGPKVIDFRNGNEDDSQLAAGSEPEADKNGTFNATNATAEADNTTNATAEADKNGTFNATNATAEADNTTNATAEADKNGTFNATNATAEAENTTNATAEAAKEVFNCSAGALRWQWGWSDEKKAHCCQHEQVGCTANATMSATASGPTTAAGSEEAGLVAMAPSSETIRKMICVAAGSPELEDEMVNLVCDEIEAAMPWAKDQFEPDCGTALKAAWADILADCPRDTQAPSSEDITRIMCNFALGDGLRGQALRDMCKVVEREFPWMKLEPNCHTVLEGMADRAAQGCNGSRECRRGSARTGGPETIAQRSGCVASAGAARKTGGGAASTSGGSAAMTKRAWAAADHGPRLTSHRVVAQRDQLADGAQVLSVSFYGQAKPGPTGDNIALLELASEHDPCDGHHGHLVEHHLVLRHGVDDDGHHRHLDEHLGDEHHLDNADDRAVDTCRYRKVGVHLSDTEPDFRCHYRAL
ncbi:unnamed protein product [Prorocentrum cordatum]|uniref:Uncharacterized protein n=1 Tax=Prorocentrum cordatum TaxID=2364126 RepID=A0ABN9S2N4_9DINO|nr:unnamed protein product [Polarella glacialis]